MKQYKAQEVHDAMLRLTKNKDFKVFTDLWKSDIERLSQVIAGGDCKDYDSYKLSVLRRTTLLDILESPLRFVGEHAEREVMNGDTNMDPYMSAEDLLP